MSAINDNNSLDREWVQLMFRAREMGYSAEEVRKIIKTLQEEQLKPIHEAYA